MRRRRVFWPAAALLVVAAFVAYHVKDPEQRPLDAAARQAAPGRFVQLTDGITHYEVAGPDTGRVVVLAAGSSVPGYIWSPLFETLADSGFRVIRYDYYGRGWSDRPSKDYSQALYVRQLRELLDSLGVHQSIALAGLSFGGNVITSFADSFPARVGSLIYTDPGFIRPGHPPYRVRSSLLWNFSMVFRGGTDAMATGQLTDFLHPERHPDWVGRYRVQQQFRGTRSALRAAQLANAASPDPHEQIRRVGAGRPVLIIWGRQDHTVPFRFSDSLRALIPTAEFVPVDSAGHLPHIERPDVVVPAVIGFLRGAAEKR
jgi:pimeloyl-ACP methyl ester carboxylesterase